MVGAWTVKTRWSFADHALCLCRTCGSHRGQTTFGDLCRWPDLAGECCGELREVAGDEEAERWRDTHGPMLVEPREEAV